MASVQKATIMWEAPSSWSSVSTLNSSHFKLQTHLPYRSIRALMAHKSCFIQHRKSETLPSTGYSPSKVTVFREIVQSTKSIQPYIYVSKRWLYLLPTVPSRIINTHYKMCKNYCINITRNNNSKFPLREQQDLFIFVLQHHHLNLTSLNNILNNCRENVFFEKCFYFSFAQKIQHLNFTKLY